MHWVIFLASSVMVAFASIQLSRNADVISVRTGLSGLFMGTLVLASVTSLPEALMVANAVNTRMPDLAVGNLMGSNMFNISILAVLDLIHQRHRILRKALMKHSVAGSLAVLMIAMAVFSIYAKLPFYIPLGRVHVGLDALALVAVYVLGVMQIQKQSGSSRAPAPDPEDLKGLPPLWLAIVFFLLAAGVVVAGMPWLVRSAGQIAESTGLGQSFIGITLVAVVTSVPELVTTISAARIGADDMAIGNLFGSNMFNMFMLGAADLFTFGDPLFTTISSDFILVGLLGVVMNALALFGNQARIERRLLFIEVDAALLLLLYIGGMALMYSRGIAP